MNPQCNIALYKIEIIKTLRLFRAYSNVTSREKQIFTAGLFKNEA